jgi:hypothetical protein
VSGFHPHVREINRLIGRAFAESKRLGDGFASDEHFALAILRPEEDSIAAQVLRQLGVTYERFEQGFLHQRARSHPTPGPADTSEGIHTTPAAHELLGRAEGIAAGLGSDAVTTEHVLLAFLWPPELEFTFERLGTSRQAVLDRLAERGVAVPEAPLPPPPAVPQGKHQLVYLPQEQLEAVLRQLPQLLPPESNWGWNLDGDYRAWVSAYGDFDLDALVHQAQDAS